MDIFRSTEEDIIQKVLQFQHNVIQNNNQLHIILQEQDYQIIFN